MLAVTDTHTLYLGCGTGGLLQHRPVHRGGAHCQAQHLPQESIHCCCGKPCNQHRKYNLGNLLTQGNNANYNSADMDLLDILKIWIRNQPSDTFLIRPVRKI